MVLYKKIFKLIWFQTIRNFATITLLQNHIEKIASPVSEQSQPMNALRCRNPRPLCKTLLNYWTDKHISTGWKDFPKQWMRESDAVNASFIINKLKGFSVCWVKCWGKCHESAQSSDTINNYFSSAQRGTARVRYL